jgi:hypothetical protein
MGGKDGSNIQVLSCPRERKGIETKQVYFKRTKNISMEAQEQQQQQHINVPFENNNMTTTAHKIPATYEMVEFWIRTFVRNFKNTVADWVTKAPDHTKDELFVKVEQFRHALRAMYLHVFPNRSFSDRMGALRSAFDTLVVVKEKNTDKNFLNNHLRKETVLLKTWHNIPSMICRVICEYYHDDDWYWSEIAKVVDDCLMYQQEMEEEKDAYTQCGWLADDKNNNTNIKQHRLSVLDVQNGVYHETTSLLYDPFEKNCPVVFWKYLLFCLKKKHMNIEDSEVNAQWRMVWDLLHECMVNKHSPEFVNHLSTIPGLCDCFRMVQLLALRERTIGNDLRYLFLMHPSLDQRSDEYATHSFPLDNYFYMTNQQKVPNLLARVAKKCRFPKPTIVPSFDHVYGRIRNLAHDVLQQKVSHHSWSTPIEYVSELPNLFIRMENQNQSGRVSSFLHAILDDHLLHHDFLHGCNANRDYRVLNFFESYYTNHPQLSCQPNCKRQFISIENISLYTICLQAFAICRGLYCPRKETNLKTHSSFDFEEWPHLQTICMLRFLCQFETRFVTQFGFFEKQELSEREAEQTETDLFVRLHNFSERVFVHLCRMAVYMCPSNKENFEHSP